MKSEILKLTQQFDALSLQNSAKNKVSNVYRRDKFDTEEDEREDYRVSDVELVTQIAT